MSLVAYDASSDEEDAGEPPAAAAPSRPPVASSIGPQPRPPSPSTAVGASPQPTPPPPPAPSQNVAPISARNVSLPTPSLDLPDVADLFAPPAENASRKRESNGSALHNSCSKFPRTQPQPQGIRNASGNSLISRQLRGRNVAPISARNVSLPTPSLDLPDVADLFAPPAENASSKRESNGSALHNSRSKFPRTQPQPQGVRNAAGNSLIPPQLRGRSNVVTEDMSKLFVAKRKE